MLSTYLYVSGVGRCILRYVLVARCGNLMMIASLAQGAAVKLVWVQQYLENFSGGGSTLPAAKLLICI